MKAMFHVKHLCFLVMMVSFFQVKGQGSISMSTNTVNYNIPKDVGLKNALIASNGYKTLSNDEKEVLYYLNYARKNPAIFLDKAVNVFVAGHPEINSSYIKSLQELYKNLIKREIILPDSSLGLVSKSHALDMEIHQTISHNSSNGKTFQQRVGPYLKNCGSEAIHASPHFVPLEAILLLLFDFNVPDLGHRKALLNENFTKAGFGIALSNTANSILVIDFSCQ